MKPTDIVILLDYASAISKSDILSRFVFVLKIICKWSLHNETLITEFMSLLHTRNLIKVPAVVS